MYRKYKQLRHRLSLWSKGFSAVQVIVSYYLILTLITMGLLAYPLFLKPGVKISLSDLFFLSSSVVSVTGLTPLPLNDLFNTSGIILLQFLFQVGGLGIMMISTFFYLAARKKVSLRTRQLIMTDMNQPNLSGTVRLIKVALIFLIFLQLFFGLFFAGYFLLKGYETNFSNALFSGIYHGVSAVTNAGFDFSGESLMPFAKDGFFLSLMMLLIFLGGIGFPVILEVYDYFKYTKRRKKERTLLPYCFSLFTRLAVVAAFSLLIIGSLSIYLLEKNHLFADKSLSDSFLTSLFYSISTRNAGMQINNLNDFQPATQLLFAALMFIGCSPSSVGGGVRTTTIIILALYLISFLKSEDDVHIFSRKVHPDDVRKSVVVFNLSLLLCFVSVLFLSATEDLPFIALVLEVASAFGTTGLSLGITGSLSVTGKLVISLLMLIGRVGMLYTLLLFIPKETRDLNYSYPVEKVITG